MGEQSQRLSQKQGELLKKSKQINNASPVMLDEEI